MKGFHDGEGVPAPPGDSRRWLRYSQAVADAVIAETRAGKVLHELCAAPGMPPVRVVVRWSQERPEFAAAMRVAREEGGLLLRGGTRSTYSVDIAEAICGRLCAGETMVSVLRDPDMPGYTTVYKWLKDVPEFRSAVALAREVQGQRLAEIGWEVACEATAETAFLTRVKLEHLRWYAGKLSPRRYGAMKPVDPAAKGERALHVYTKKFVLGPGREPGRWSEEPAEHLYSMRPVGDYEGAGERLPPPAVAREPNSTRGPNARWEARGGAVEAEYDEDGEDDVLGDDYWG